jgi:hypothetical protein
VRGQIESMNGAFERLTLGLLFAAVFVYLLMVVNYQSFIDPLAVILALPGAAPASSDAVRDRHHAVGAVADGRDHGGRRRLGQLDPAGDLRARAAASGRPWARSRPRFRPAPRGCGRC